MSYFSIFFVSFLYFLSNIQINFALASANAGVSDESKSINNSIDEDPVYLITGGYRPSERTLYKYAVSLCRPRQSDYQSRKYFGTTHFCGGSILSPTLILTAAHCLKPEGEILSPHSVEVVTSTPKRLMRTLQTQVIEVSGVIAHEGFKGISVYYDIGLLKLKSKIDLDGTYAQAIPLPQAPPVVGTVCVSVGWGRLYWTGPKANEILYANLTVMSDSYCRRKFSIDMDKQICVFDSYNKEAAACVGDSGGPLICNGFVAGVVSYGFKCEKGWPTVYTDVYEYLDWIRRSTSGNLHASVWNLRFVIVLWATILF